MIIFLVVMSSACRRSGCQSEKFIPATGFQIEFL